MSPYGSFYNCTKKGISNFPMTSHQPATVERKFAPVVVSHRLLSSLQRCQMRGGDAGRGPAAWTAKNQRWYADLMVQCMEPKRSRAAINVPAVLGQLAAMPLDECVHMRGNTCALNVCLYVSLFVVCALPDYDRMSTVASDAW